MSMTLNHDNYEIISTRSFLYVTVVQSKLGMRTINELRKSRIARTERQKKAFTKKNRGVCYS